MSIPPLVCSTPPPPEQCEDDKDHEDFDLTYHLSQEDDDDDDSTEYNYGNISGYNTYPPKIEQIEKDNWPSNLNNERNPDITIKSEEITDVSFISNDHLFNENTPKFEENILEDLNLQVNSDNVHSTDISPKHYETDVDIYNNECSDKNSMIQDQGGTDILGNIEETTKASDLTTVADSNISNDSDKLNYENGEIKKIVEDSPVGLSEITLDDKISDIENEENIAECNFSNDLEIANEDPIKNKSLSDDEFGDFEDFQFTVSSNTQVLSVDSENPWNNNTSESPDFGNFKANFDNSNPKEIADDSPIKVKDSEIETSPGDYDDDDFGDFDDFKTSANHPEGEECPKDGEIILPSNVSMLRFHSPENELQIVDSINNVLTSIFTKEITEPQNDLEGKLELYLSETWGHLVDIDVRQPYIINWNNSLGQKTLLKALCIDSRNILFGPKWNYNMPKYATNLSSAPLQPQKQLAQSNISVSESTEKAPNKEAPSWIDPFTPDGQEYTYAEALLLDLEHLMATLDQMAHKHSSLKISELLSHACSSENESAKAESIKRPTDLDVFGSEPSTKLNKIYSNTINVQPLRHINLPDTHIFTPTDSETPRSKTIHYDSALPAIVPQPASETVKSQPEQQISQSSNITENEYWEFQDFKGITTEVPTNNLPIEEPTAVNSLSDSTATKPGITYQTQILQPIKMEPIIPTLNWPDPGEVKETFDDFSEFVSSNSWNNEKDITNCETDEQKINPKTEESNNEVRPIYENIEDEFETFQSAPVTRPIVNVSPSVIDTKNITTNTDTQKVAENFDTAPFKKEENNIMGSNTLFVEKKSSTSTTIPNLQDSVFTKPSTGIERFSNHPMNSDILQPTTSSSAGTIRNPHTTGQILQPLSLESYSQINWPNPGIDLQDLSRFNPINSLDSLKSDISAGNSKIGSPMHTSASTVNKEIADDDIWGDFVSSIPKPQQISPKKNINFVDDDEWTDFVSSPSIKPQNGLNTISLNVHTNSSMHKAVNQNKFASGSNQIQLDIPALNYITPKSNNHGMYMEKHFQNL